MAPLGTRTLLPAGALVRPAQLHTAARWSELPGREAHPPARRRRLAVVPQAISLPKPSGLLADDRLPSWLALAAWGAQALATRVPQLAGFSLSPELIYQGLGWYTPANAALSVAQDKFEVDAIGTLVGPLFLSIQALGGVPGLHLSSWDAATTAFAPLIIRRLPQFQGSQLAWLGTLAGAIYAHLTPQWVVGAFGLAAAWRLVQGALQGTGIPWEEAVFACFAASALWTGAWVPTAVAVWAGQLLASVFS